MMSTKRKQNKPQKILDPITTTTTTNTTTSSDCNTNNNNISDENKNNQNIVAAFSNENYLKQQQEQFNSNKKNIEENKEESSSNQQESNTTTTPSNCNTLNSNIIIMPQLVETTKNENITSLSTSSTLTSSSSVTNINNQENCSIPLDLSKNLQNFKESDSSSSSSSISNLANNFSINSTTKINSNISPKPSPTPTPINNSHDRELLNEKNLNTSSTTTNISIKSNNSNNNNNNDASIVSSSNINEKLNNKLNSSSSSPYSNLFSPNINSIGNEEASYSNFLRNLLTSSSSSSSFNPATLTTTPPYSYPFDNSFEKMLLFNLAPFLFGPQVPPLLNQAQAPSLHQLSALSQYHYYHNMQHQQQFQPQIDDKLKKNDHLECSCGAFFDSLESITHHSKQTNHKPKIMMLTHQQNQSPTQKSSTISKPKKRSSDSMSLVSPVDVHATSTKMVRGQEEWVNNSRNNNFISQILKCLECSASFETLSDLSAHMIDSKHFSKFHPAALTASSSSGPTSTMPNNNTNNNNEQSKSSFVLNSSKHSSAFSLCKSSTKSSPVTSSKAFTSTTKTEDQSNSNNKSCKNNKNSLLNQGNLHCNICKKNFNNGSYSSSTASLLPPLVELIQHLQNVHSIKNICTNCGAYFHTSKELSDHLIEEQINTRQSNKSHHNNNANNANKINESFSSHDYVEFNNSSKKLKVSVNNNIKQDKQHLNHHDVDYIKQSNNNSSISPSSSVSSFSSSSSSSISSANSSPSSFLFEPNQLINNNAKNDKPSSKGNSNHPLLALQMFVNGNSTFDSEYQPKSKLADKPQNQVQQDNSTPASSPLLAKLPAKKRPYVEDEPSTQKKESNNEIQHGIKRILGEYGSPAKKQLNDYPENNNTNENRFKTSNTNLTSTSSLSSSSQIMAPSTGLPSTLYTTPSNQYHPLNLLQKMQLHLDEYFYRS